MKQLKKALAFALSAFIILSFLPAFSVFAVEGTSFTVSNASGAPGSKVTVDLILDKGCDAVTLRIFMKYDKSVLKATYYKWKDSMTIGQRSISATDGQVLVTGITYNGSSTLSTPGTIVTVTFEISKDAKPGSEYPIDLFINSSGDLVADNYEPIPYTLNSGKITVTNGGSAGNESTEPETETKEDNKPKPSEDYEFNTDIDNDIANTIIDKIDGSSASADITNTQVQTTNVQGQTTPGADTSSKPSDKKNVAVVEIKKKFGVDEAGNKIVMEIPDAVKKSDNIQVYKYDIQSDTLVPINDSTVKGDLIEFEALDEGYYVFSEAEGKNKSVSALTVAITAGAVFSAAVIALCAFLIVKKKKDERGSSDE